MGVSHDKMLYFNSSITVYQVPFFLYIISLRYINTVVKSTWRNLTFITICKCTVQWLRIFTLLYAMDHVWNISLYVESNPTFSVIKLFLKKAFWLYWLLDAYSSFFLFGELVSGQTWPIRRQNLLNVQFSSCNSAQPHGDCHCKETEVQKQLLTQLHASPPSHSSLLTQCEYS